MRKYLTLCALTAALGACVPEENTAFSSAFTTNTICPGGYDHGSLGESICYDDPSIVVWVREEDALNNCLLGVESVPFTEDVEHYMCVRELEDPGPPY